MNGSRAREINPIVCSLRSLLLVCGALESGDLSRGDGLLAIGRGELFLYGKTFRDPI